MNKSKEEKSFIMKKSFYILALALFSFLAMTYLMKDIMNALLLGGIIIIVIPYLIYIIHHKLEHNIEKQITHKRVKTKHSRPKQKKSSHGDIISHMRGK